jgi:hypothetical protein
VKKLPGGGTGSPTVLATLCESLEAACPHAVFPENVEFFHTFPLRG